LSDRLQPRAVLASLACSCALLAAGAANSQSTHPFDPSRLAITQYRVDGWQTEQGLPQNTAQAMYQSRDGYLWVGTGAGLARFDGVRFATFESVPIVEIASRPIFGFMEDAEGALWIGHSRGATRYRDGRFERVIDNEMMQGRRVWAFAQDRAGVVWAATENGLVRWEKGALRLFTEADGLPTRRLRSIDIDREGTLWIGTTGGGLVSYASGRFEVLGPAQGFPHPEVRHVLADPAGGIWAATAGAGLVRVQGGRMKTYTTANGLPTDQLTYLARDKFGALWIGTWGAGVSRMVDERFSSISSARGLGGDQIWSVHVDREGSVWVGTWNSGLGRLSARAFVVFGQPEGLAGDNVRSVIHARDGSAWVASAGGGVNRIVGGHVTATVTTRQGLPTDEASALFEDHDGAIWIATYTNGLARLKDGRIQAFGRREGLPSVDVRVVHRDRAGTLWAGTVAGLARFDAGVFVPMREEGAPPEGVTAIVEDRGGVLWVGTSGDGLYRYHEGRFSKLTRKEGLASNWIVALYEDAAGSLWIGTNGEGINRLRNGRIATIGVADGLWDGLAQVFLEDSRGYFWMTCNRGFFRVARSELDAFVEGRIAKVSSNGYGPGYALRTSTFAGGLQPAGAVDADGYLWLPSLKGLVIVDPTHLPDAGAPPPVFIEEVAVDGRRAPPQAEILLPPGSHPLSVRFTAGTLIDASRARFRYRLEGISPDWVDAGASREAAFPALPAGRYLFRVATSVDGRRWREAAAPLPIVVEPRFYEAQWFILLVAAASLALIAALFNLRTRQLRANQVEMQRLVAMKTEELRVANEHLSRLSFADSLTGLANRRHLDEVLQGEWRRAQRAGSSLAVVIADIDAFKAYNDSLGHIQGDKCLVAVADVIRSASGRAGDFAARYGGEEFVILIPDADRASALAFAEGLRKACEARAIAHPASPAGPVVTLSLGVAARIPVGEATAEGLVAEADAALYRAKQEGRNRVR
jgi:diguanylate cyclase (GGDEF)-like protein